MAHSARFRKAQAKKTRAERRKNLAKAIENSYSSLRSHLGDAVECTSGDNNRGNEEWQAFCVREYAHTINTLAVELHELTKKDFPRTFDTLKKKLT